MALRGILRVFADMRRGQFNEAEVATRRANSGREVLAEWNALADLRLDTLRTADDAYFAREMMNPTGPGTMADFLQIRVLDCWIHEQDMRRAVERPGHMVGPAAEHTIDRLVRTIPIVVGKRAATPGGPAPCSSGRSTRCFATFQLP